MRPTLTATRNLLLLAIVLVGLRLAFGMAPLEQLMHKIVTPGSALAEKFAFTSDAQVTADENYQAKIQELEQKNEQLRQQLDINKDFVTAEVIRKDITGFRKSFIINKGSDHGLIEGQAITSGGFLIGKVLRLTPQTAVVELITDPEFKITAATETKEGGVVRNDTGSLVFDLVPGADLTGRQVFTDGVDGQIKPGIPVGVTGKRISGDDKTFHVYHLILSQPLSQIEFVEAERLAQP